MEEQGPGINSSDNLLASSQYGIKTNLKISEKWSCNKLLEYWMQNFLIKMVYRHIVTTTVLYHPTILMCILKKFWAKNFNEKPKHK